MHHTIVTTKASPRTARALVCLFFAAFLALGLFTVSGYGQPWDELDEMDILRMNLWEYAQRFGLDEAAFLRLSEQESVSISQLTPISQSMERDHGVGAFYPLAQVVMNPAMPQSTRMLYWHSACWVYFTLGAFALYACVRALGLSRGAGLLAALFLLLSPRFFAEGHYNNKDVVLMSLVLCTLWQGLFLLQKPSYPRGLCFAFFGALAANTKVIGFAVWGLCALFVLGWQLAHFAGERKSLLRCLRVDLVTLLSMLCFYTLLTPALWHEPLAFVRYLFQNATAFQRWNGFVLFRGAVFDTSTAPLPWYYLPYMMLATTPLWLLLMAFMGQVSAIAAVARKRAGLLQNSRAYSLLLVTLLWLLPLGFALLTRTRVYNGWRHFYFLYGPLLVLAVYGASTLWRKLRTRKCMRRIFAGALALGMLCTGIGMVQAHPYQFAYEQPLVRCRENGRYLELDYWNVSAVNALQTLLAQTTGNLTVGYSDLWTKAGLERGLNALPSASRARITPMAQGARYLLENPTYSVFSGFAPTQAMTDAVNIVAYGHPIMRIYEDTAAPKEVEP
ncbi:MAG: hypothetical protein RSA55_02750 [Clostridia bacterium]